LSLLFLVSCGKDQADSTSDSDPAGLERKYERGPVTVVVRVDKKEASIAERIHLSLEVTADENYEVQLPRFGEKLEQFGIVDFSTTQPELVEDNRTRQSRSYVLEPFLSGDYTIPPMTIQFQEKDAAEEEMHEIETEELKIQVNSLLPEDVADLKIHEITPPVELPRARSKWMWPVTVAVALVLAAAAGFILWIRRRKGSLAAVPKVPAHEIAFRNLEELVGENLPEKGEFKRFYQRISDILRHYIENRFGLHAPEQTTEEFLATLGTDDTLSPDQKNLLKEFLKHCDLVKFAEHQPTLDDVQRTFDSCKTFIIETKQEAASATAADAARTEDRTIAA
jgi:hypothetical protein